MLHHLKRKRLVLILTLSIFIIFLRILLIQKQSLLRPINLNPQTKTEENIAHLSILDDPKEVIIENPKPNQIELNQTTPKLMDPNDQVRPNITNPNNQTDTNITDVNNQTVSNTIQSNTQTDTNIIEPNSINCEKPNNLTSKDLNQNTSIRHISKYGVIFPEGPNIDFLFAYDSLENRPDVQFFPYPYDTPQRHLKDGSEIDRIPLNKGNEAMVYLSFIIQHYHNLPEKMLFVHNHDTAWHQRTRLVDIINKLKWDSIDSYISLQNCGLHQFINKQSKREYVGDENLPDIGGLEGEALESFLKQMNFTQYGLEVVDGIGLPGCCAQFAVTKADVLRNPIILYKELREWLINTKMPNFYSGRMFEFTWHWYFTGVSKGIDRRGDCQDVFENYQN